MTFPLLTRYPRFAHSEAASIFPLPFCPIASETAATTSAVASGLPSARRRASMMCRPSSPCLNSLDRFRAFLGLIDPTRYDGSNRVIVASRLTSSFWCRAICFLSEIMRPAIVARFSFRAAECRAEFAQELRRALREAPHPT